MTRIKHLASDPPIMEGKNDVELFIGFCECELLAERS